jgi:hypothetical protein
MIVMILRAISLWVTIETTGDVHICVVCWLVVEERGCVGWGSWFIYVKGRQLER